ncbi:hypothetical protein [Patulibacter sp. SYSU D01012]|uniref:hypothetical protein n=1 Tax=Patulibacter sp. SYSU D01012 TaxID=2817381 RepID=UPI001B30CD43|nr:hypothetical protein [Patulibacter sp. SYSU D01012]
MCDRPAPPSVAPAAAEGVQLQLHPGAGDHAALAGSVDAWRASLPAALRAHADAPAELVDRGGGLTPRALAALRDARLRAGAGADEVDRAMAAVLACARWLTARGLLPAGVLEPLQAVPRPRFVAPDPVRATRTRRAPGQLSLLDEDAATPVVARRAVARGAGTVRR